MCTILWSNINKFNTSDYPTDNGIPLVNKKVSGLMKDKNNSAIMTEFVGFRAKMYALRVDGKKDTKKVKSVESNVVEIDNVWWLHAMPARRNWNDVNAVLHKIKITRDVRYQKITLSPMIDDT